VVEEHDIKVRPEGIETRLRAALPFIIKATERVLVSQ
jgi:hypothetical protein